MKTNTLIIVALILLLGCKKNEYSEENQNSERADLVDKTIATYDVLYDWSDLDYEFTYQYEPVLNSKKQVISYPRLIDVYKKNDSIYLKVISDINRTFNFDLFITDSNNLNKIIDDYEKQEDYFMSCILVVEINKLQKIPLLANPYSEIIDGEIEHSFIELETNDNFIGSGKITDFKFL
jgi:hypothetical protein